MKIQVLISLFFVSYLAYNQNNETGHQNNVKNADTLKSTFKLSPSIGQILYDNSPSSIDIAPYTKPYSFNVLDQNNFSVDLSPFMFKKSFSGWAFYGIDKNGKENIFNNIEKITFSLVHAKEEQQRKVIVGFKSNIITYLGKKKAKKVEVFRQDVSKKIDSVQLLLKQRGLSPNADGYDTLLMSEINKLEFITDDIYEDLNKPVYALDVAAAYGHIFVDDKLSNNKSGRFASWLTSKYALSLTKKGFINVLVIGRYVHDPNFMSNETFSKKSFFDFGTKIQLAFNRISFGYEYIKRSGDFSDYRSVGSVQYKISNNLCLNGGFGKNFIENDKSTFTLLGVSFGFIENNQSMTFEQ